MSIGLVGQKCGMTRVFQEDGTSVPVTVVHVQPNRIVQIKTRENDGYDALQVTTGERKRSRVNKAEAGHFAKAGVEAGTGLWEFSISPEELTVSGEEGETTLAAGSEITVDIFSDGQSVDVTGTSKGKGFAGVVKRHNFSMQDATHGNSLSHRAHGSTGQNQTPGRVFKGKKMAGQMGNKRVTQQNLSVLRVDSERNLLLIRGAVPGAASSTVIVRGAVKANDKAN